MEIRNASVFIGHSFKTADITFEKEFIKIQEKEQETPEQECDGYIIPGLVDIHTHGAIGEDFSDGNPKGFLRLKDYYAAQGVTSFLATTMTLPEENLCGALKVAGNCVCQKSTKFSNQKGAKCEGIHLEGPFLNFEKRGAHNADYLKMPDTDLFHRLNEDSGNKIRMVTVACELPGAMKFIKEISETCAVSLGHSACDYESAMRAFDAGASHVTHLFNAMPSLHHRNPGIIGAALDHGATVELICDGIHVHPAVVRMAFRMFGDKINLISDSLRCAGMPDGVYSLSGQDIMMQDKKAVLPDGTLAGSSISLLDGLRLAVKFGIPFEEAVYAAATAPAEAAGLKAGKIEVGRPADFLILNKKLELQAVYIEGEKVLSVPDL